MGTQLLHPAPKKGAQPSSFRPMSVVVKLLMLQDTTWYGGRPWPRRHCVRWDPAPSQRGTSPIFGPCLLWPNGHPSQLLLSSCYGRPMKLYFCPVVFTAPQCSHCNFASAVLATAIPSVRPSFRHTPVLCQNDVTQHGAVCTVG